jgi:hypothetical protein
MFFHELNITSTIWWPSCGEFFSIFYSNEKVFYDFCWFTVDERVQMNNVVFSIQNLKGYVLREYLFVIIIS